MTKTHVAWTLKKGGPAHASPLLVGDELYVVSDSGHVLVRRREEGDGIWEDKLKGAYSASPIYANGNIYLTSEEGKGHADRGRPKEGTSSASSTLKEKTFASFAAADGALYVRTESNSTSSPGGEATPKTRRL